MRCERGRLPPLPMPVGIVLVVAVAENGVIGRDNAMPWRIKSDLKYFRSVTINKPVIMGRKTYASIGKPLPGRTNIVVTRNSDFAAPGILVAPGIEQALSAARGDALRRGTNEIAVIGGTEIFAQTMAVADRIALTRVHANPPGDTYMPAIDAARLARDRADTDTSQGPATIMALLLCNMSASARHERAL